jgi:hypothetical protein
MEQDQKQMIIAKKYVDRALKEVDNKTLNKLTELPPQVSFYLMLSLGKELCEQDEWNAIVKQLKPRWYEWILNFLKRLARSANTPGS